MNSCVGSVDSHTPSLRLGVDGANPIPTLFLKRDYWVKDVPLQVAKELVQKWHYARGGSNTRVYTHGLFFRDYEQCLGVAWWLPPTKSAALSIEDNWKGVLALSRLVVSPDVPKNAESFLIRKSMSLIDRIRWPVFVTYADSWQHHEGVIYYASGWRHDGFTKPERRYVKDGVFVSRKHGPTTRTHAEMLSFGCECLGKFSAKRFVHRVGYDKKGGK